MRGCAKAFGPAAVGFALATATPAQARDLELGRYLAGECLTCHRAATSKSQIPDIFGMAEGTFIEVIRAYRERRLANAVMQSIAARLADDEVASLAYYFATERKP